MISIRDWNFVCWIEIFRRKSRRHFRNLRFELVHDLGLTLELRLQGHGQVQIEGFENDVSNFNDIRTSLTEQGRQNYDS